MLAECIALGLFLAGLGLCIVTGIQILYALLFGLLCFSIYCLAKGYSARGNRLHAVGGYFPGTEYPYYFVFIGGLTAVWRISGTIPYILYYAVGFIHPRYFVALHLPPVFFHVLPHRYLLWHGKYHGGHMYAHIECSRLKPPLFLQAAPSSPEVFRGPLLPHVLQRPADMQPDPDRHLSEHKAYVPQQRNPLAVTCILYVVLASGSSAPADRELLDLFRTISPSTGPP